MGEALATTAAIGAATNLVGGIISGGAAAEGARAEQRQAQADRNLAMQYAAPSPEELAQLNQMIEMNDKEIARKQELLDSADPALIEAGKQALQLMQGEEAKTLDPIRRQREKDRERVVEMLRDRYGSGAEESTAGQQALAEFDAQTSAVLAQEQDRTLGRFLGIAQGISSQGLSQEIGQAGTIAGLFGNIRGRQVSAITGTPLAQYAGAGSVGRAMFGRNLANLGSTAIQGATMGALYGGKGGKFGDLFKNLFGGGGGGADVVRAGGISGPVDGGGLLDFPGHGIPAPGTK